MKAIRIFDPTDEIEEDTMFGFADGAARWIQTKLEEALENDEPLKIEVSVIELRNEEYDKLVGWQPTDFDEEETGLHNADL